ncbi:hypothetical protein CHLRE_11g467722v5 [Chlamydomonas reinhardtii]|uniref:Uncharacterized protein n=1 Tax=Chlamydomonas reinhardtii TaxID=3055 RepID=A8JEF8_CHLRE|nr:uncharacterized protein CHLRE_11g467722v5 [Chlamydomonas reinhardtii]PNW76598.1 hypothetical protein CHLRE_11g467722v5 [Chlamydomonas reinhardtii]|eukprot:XP_001701171.1 predicted protein [Chlamydomonas reinhardtii]
MDQHQSAYSRRIIRVNRIIAGTIVAGCVAVLTGAVDVKFYQNEVEYAKETPDRDRFKSHRCNDRLADALEVVEAEDGNIWRDLRPAFRNWWACMRSAEGSEPAMPYIMLTPKYKQYIDPVTRSEAARRAAQVQAEQQLQG